MLLEQHQTRNVSCKKTLLCSIATLIIGMLWKRKLRLVALKNFVLFAMAESILAFTLSMILVFVYYNVWIFVATLLYSSMITNFVCKCIMMFKSRLWLEKSREEYDNTDSVVRSLIMILGFWSCYIHDAFFEGSNSNFRNGLHL